MALACRTSLRPDPFLSPPRRCCLVTQSCAEFSVKDHNICATFTWYLGGHYDTRVHKLLSKVMREEFGTSWYKNKSERIKQPSRDDVVVSLTVAGECVKSYFTLEGVTAEKACGRKFDDVTHPPGASHDAQHLGPCLPQQSTSLDYV